MVRRYVIGFYTHKEPTVILLYFIQTYFIVIDCSAPL